MGGGLETVVFDNLIARVECRYSDFGGHDMNFFGTPLDADYFGVRTRMTASTVTVGLAYKFGSPAPAPVVARY